jgi:hypothetical protein
MDDIFIKRRLVNGLLFLGVVALSFYAIKSGSPLFGGLMMASLVGVFFLTKPTLMVVLVPLAFYSKLIIPGMPGSLTMNYMFQGLLIVWWIGASALSRVPRSSFIVADRMVLGFALVMLATMAVRGFGIMTMGSMAYGGMGYIYMLLWVSFYLICRQVKINDQQINNLMIYLCAATLIPLILLVVVYVHPGLYRIVSSFTVISFTTIAEAVQTGEMGQSRWGPAAVLAQFVIYYALTAPFRKRSMHKRVILIVFAVFAVLISGFRSTLVSTFMTIVLWGIVRSKNKVLFITFIGVAILVFWGAAVLFVDYLPINMQRTVSFLPGVKIYGENAARAQGSIDWRVDVWKYAVTRIPEYLLIGRGFVADVTSAAWMQANYYTTVEFAWMVSNYHNGPLSILLTFGLPGAIAFYGFLFAGVGYGIQKIRQYQIHHDLYAYVLLQFFTMLLCQKVFLYTFGMGEVRSDFPQFVLWIVMIRWAVQSLERNICTASLLAQKTFCK